MVLLLLLYIRLINLKGHIDFLAGEKKTDKKIDKKIPGQFFNVAHHSARCCIVVLPIRIDSVR